MNAIAITTIILLAAAAIFAGTAAWAAHRRWQKARQQAHLLAREQQGTERALHKLVHETLPQIHQAGGRISVPATAPELAGTSVGEQLTLVTKCAADVVQAVVRDIQHAAHREIEQRKTIGTEEIARVRATAVRSTEAAVRSVSSALVGMAAKTSRKVSEGVREHEDDAAFETLTGIDHTVQQMLLVAQGWTILAGGKLTRHWPTTTLTDVVRASMGYVEGYQRVQPQELTVAVKTRVVGPVVHTLALLLDNALRFSPAQSRVHVFLTVLGLVGVVVGLAAAALLLGFAPPSVAVWAAAPALLVGGIGSGFVISPNVTMTLREVQVPMAGAAGGALQTGQRLGGAVGTAALPGTYYLVLTSSGNDYRLAVAASVGVGIAAILTALGIALIEWRTDRGATAAPCPPEVVHGHCHATQS
ncbi:hypothetical protein [Streptomyces decoyicus]